MSGIPEGTALAFEEFHHPLRPIILHAHFLQRARKCFRKASK